VDDLAILAKMPNSKKGLKKFRSTFALNLYLAHLLAR
jgi:hypothetical protein